VPVACYWFDWRGEMRWTDDTQMSIDIIESFLVTGKIDPDWSSFIRPFEIMKSQLRILWPRFMNLKPPPSLRSEFFVSKKRHIA
jgi:hypothetical protein